MKQKAFIVHFLEHCETALEAASALNQSASLLTSPHLVFSAGPLYIAKMYEMAKEAYPKAESILVVDCGDSPGMVLQALRCGLKTIGFEPTHQSFAKLQQIAAQYGAEVINPDFMTLDLLRLKNPLEKSMEWLEINTEAA